MEASWCGEAFLQQGQRVFLDLMERRMALLLKHGKPEIFLYA